MSVQFGWWLIRLISLNKLDDGLFFSFFLISIKSIEIASIDIHLKIISKCLYNDTRAHVNRHIEFAINALNSIHSFIYLRCSSFIFPRIMANQLRNYLSSWFLCVAISKNIVCRYWFILFRMISILPNDMDSGRQKQNRRCIYYILNYRKRHFTQNI